MERSGHRKNVSEERKEESSTPTPDLDYGLVVEDRASRKNGFSCPWNIYQIIVWIEYLINIVSYFTIELPYIKNL